MSERESTIGVGDAGTLRALAEAYAPALDDAADRRREGGDRRGAKLARDLADVWMEIAHMADAAIADGESAEP